MSGIIPLLVSAALAAPPQPRPQSPAQPQPQPQAAADRIAAQVRSFVERGRVAMADERFDDARRLARYALVLVPDDKAALALARDAEWAAVQDELEQGGPDSTARKRQFERRLRWGKAALDAGDWRAAIRHFDSAGFWLKEGDPHFAAGSVELDEQLKRARRWTEDHREAEDAARLAEIERIREEQQRQTAAAAMRTELLDWLWNGGDLPGGRRRWFAHAGGVAALSFRPDGTLLATGGWDGKLRLWELPSGTSGDTATATNHDAVCAVAFASDGDTIATGGSDGTLRVFSVSGRPTPKVFLRHGNRVTSIAVSPDRKYLASGGLDGDVNIWGLTTDRHAVGKTFAESGGVRAVAYTRDGTHFAAALGSGVVRVWDGPLPEGDPRRFDAGVGVHALAFSPDGKTLALGDDGGVICLWVHAGKEEPAQLRLPRGTDVTRISGLAFHPDGKRLAAVSWDGKLRIWSLADRKLLRTLTASRNGAALCVAYSPDGHTLAAGGEDGFVRLWDADAPDPPRWPGLAAVWNWWTAGTGR